jgi:hypothetical protein
MNNTKSVSIFKKMNEQEVCEVKQSGRKQTQWRQQKMPESDGYEEIKCLSFQNSSIDILLFNSS